MIAHKNRGLTAQRHRGLTAQGNGGDIACHPGVLLAGISLPAVNSGQKHAGMTMGTVDRVHGSKGMR
ncbi:hypothetical protein [Nocardia sp. CDC160]|uniref:hypothetical protein n=1 Tax=Nocardia sp. CDC160 TaxID=3112166 RepID=UPI002DB97CC1|nr:hypothetical protein [Nocardia sp. CDC160]MEC3916594.1 hypothetical protein [Nocardia sp. CDC160]